MRKQTKLAFEWHGQGEIGTEEEEEEEEEKNTYIKTNF